MDKLNQFIYTSYELSQQLPLGQFVHSLFDSARQFIDFDSAGIIGFAVGAEGRLGFRSAHPFNISPEEKLKARIELQLSERVIPGKGLVGSDPIVTHTFNHKGRAFYADLSHAANRRFADYARKTGGQQCLGLMQRDAVIGAHSMLALWRPDGREFRAQDAQLAQIMIPHMIQALSINKRLLGSQSATDGGDQDPIICNGRGFISFISDAALALLREEFKDWQAPLLPSDLYRQLLLCGKQHWQGRLLSAVLKPFGDSFLLYLRRLPAHHALSPRERQIMQLLAEGHSYKHIARELGNAPATVRNQVHSLYGKLGVRRKDEIRALYQQLCNTAGFALSD